MKNFIEIEVLGKQFGKKIEYAQTTLYQENKETSNDEVGNFRIFT